MTGFICLDKDKGMTSFYAVRKARGIFSEKKAGHAGTLDPMATGVLPVALGGATRFLELFETHDKAYEGEFLLGTVTDTMDITGKVLNTSPCHVTEDELKQILPRFTGRIFQTPPMFSAIKKDGVRLYDLARQGIEVEREKREVEIYELSLLSFDERAQSFRIAVKCSKGTYIRSLGADIGELLGCGAVMTGLRRTEALGFSLENALTLTELSQMKENGTLQNAVIRVEDALPYERVDVSDLQAKRFHNGGSLEAERITHALSPCTVYRIFSRNGEFQGLGETDAECAEMKVRRVYNEL